MKLFLWFTLTVLIKLCLIAFLAILTLLPRMRLILDVESAIQFHIRVDVYDFDAV